MKKLFIILVALFFTIPAIAINPFAWVFEKAFFATTYYIDPAGNNTTGDGSIGNPWQTLYKAATTVTTSGDIIHVNAGTYNETLQIPLSVGVSIEGDSATSIITSTLTADFTPIILLASSEGTSGNQHISGIQFDGNLTCQMAIVVSGRSNVEIYNCRFFDFNDRGVVMRGKTDWSDGAPTTYATGNKFHHNFMFNCARSDASYGRGCLEVGGQIGIEIYNDTIIQNARASNLSGYCIKNANQGFLKGMKIYNNYLEVPPYPYPVVNTNNHWSFATEFSDLWGMEYYNNRVYGSADQNHQHTDGTYSYSVWYHDNTFGFNTLLANPVEGIILEYNTDGAIIENNIFKNTCVPLYFTPRLNSSITNLIYRRNYCPDVGMSVSESYAQGIKINSQGAFTAYNWKVYNNTFIANTTAAPQYGLDVPAGDSMYFVNNIVRGFGIGDIHIYDGNNNRFLTLKNNNFISKSVTGSPVQSDTTGNVNVAPDINATTGVPNSGSPMIDAGIYSGISYYGLRIDIGSGEYPTAGNASPTAIVPANRRLIQPANSLTLTGYGYDPDGTVTTYAWTQVSGASSATFGSASAASTTVNNLTSLGAHVFRLTVTDNSGTTSYSEVTITVVVAGSNALPVVTASANQTITLPSSTVTVSQSATDADGSVVSYLWNKLSGSGSITSTTSTSTSVTGLDVGLTVLEATATDNDGGVGRDTMYITVNPQTVTVVTSYAGTDKTITLPTTTTTLQGYGIPPTTGGYNLFLYSEEGGQTPQWDGNTFSVSNNQANDLTGSNTMELLTYSAAGVSYWGQTLTVSPSTTYYFSFDVQRGSATDVYWGVRDQSNFNDLVAPTSYYSLTSASGVTRVQLSFTTTSSTTSVTVHPIYKAPTTGTIYLGRLQLATASNQLYHVTTTTAYTAGNTTGTISAYLWTQLTGTASTIVTTTDDTTSITGLSTAGVRTYELRVTDNLGAIARDTVTVTVNAGSNNPPTANAGTDQSITLPTSTVNLSGSGTDTDGTIVSYAWTQISGTSASITSASSALTTITGLSTAGVRVFRLTVTDNSGDTGTDDITITVNAAPPVSSGSGKTYKRVRGSKVTN